MKKYKHPAIPVFVMSALLALPASIQAQDVPPGQIIGAEQQRFEEEKERREQERKLREKKVPDPVAAEKKETSADYSGPAFRMNDILITGNEEIPTERLQPIAGRLLNRDVNFGEIEEVVSEIKQLYRREGFIATYVYVPPQKVKEGVIELRIVEGRLGEIEVTGNRWFSDGVIAKLVEMRPGKVLQFKELASKIERVNEHRDVKAKAVLKPGKEEGTTDVEVQVKDKFPVHLSTDVTNLGTEATGKTRWGAGLTHTNLLGRMDQASVRYQLGKGAWAIGADYNLPLNRHGTRFNFSYQHSSIDLGGRFDALNIKGSAHTFSPQVSHPVYRGEHLKISAKTGFDFKEIESRALGQQAGKDSLRILNTGLAFEERDRYGRSYFDNSVNFGFSSFLGASSKTETGATRPGTGGQFFIYRQTALRYFILPADLGLVLRSGLQLTNDMLPPSEQFRLGGAFSVRGYPESEYLADYGTTVSSELYVPSYFFPKHWKLPFAQQPLRQQIKGTLFFDTGYGNNRRVLTGESGKRTLAGYGAGVRIHLFDRVYARVEWAKPTADSPRDNSESAFYFGVSAEIF